MAYTVFTILSVLLCIEHFGTASPIDPEIPEKPVILPTCRNRGIAKHFCEDTYSNYPDHIIEKLLSRLEKNWTQSINTIGDRDSDPLEKQCEVSKLNKEIYTMVDEHGEVRYVVQNKKFTQIIRMEWCLQPGLLTGPTNSLSKTTISNNRFNCTQKYLNFKFLVLSKNGRKLETARMKGGVPVCCACEKITEVENIYLDANLQK